MLFPVKYIILFVHNYIHLVQRCSVNKYDQPILEVPLTANLLDKLRFVNESRASLLFNQSMILFSRFYLEIQSL